MLATLRLRQAISCSIYALGAVENHGLKVHRKLRALLDHTHCIHISGGTGEISYTARGDPSAVPEAAPEFATDSSFGLYQRGWKVATSGPEVSSA